jgi:transcriptional regulator
MVRARWSFGPDCAACGVVEASVRRRTSVSPYRMPQCSGLRLRRAPAARNGRARPHVDANFCRAFSVQADCLDILGIVPKSPKPPNALLHGALDALILKTLAAGPRHGYAIARFIEDTTGDALLVEEGSLYPALYRMEQRGWIEAEWGMSELGRRAKVYRLTPAGRAQLEEETAVWRRFSVAVSKMLLSR